MQTVFGRMVSFHIASAHDQKNLLSGEQGKSHLSALGHHLDVGSSEGTQCFV